MRIVLHTFGSLGDIHRPARAADLIENVLGPAPERDEELAHAAGD